MSLGDLFMTTVSPDSPLDGSKGTDPQGKASDFLTVQSFMNFAAMTGAITAAWHALQLIATWALALWVPYVLAFCWGGISFAISFKELEKKSSATYGIGVFAQAIFIAFINALILAGTNVAVGQTG